MDNNDKVNPEELAKALESIFGNMLESDKKETKNLYGEFIEELIDENKDLIEDAEDFDVFVNYQINKVLEVYLEEILKKEIKEVQDTRKIYDILFLYKNYGFLERNVKKLIVLKEGSPCSADKSRWILRSYKNFLISGTIPDMGDKKECYWKPKFGTGEKWVEFCESLVRLHSGNPDRYLLALKSLIDDNKEVLN